MLGILQLLFNGVKTLVNWQREKSVAKHERDMAQLQLERRLLLSKQEANSQWEIAQLNDKDKLLRWAAFLLFASPLVTSFISPELGARVQHAWHTLPIWQANVLSGMCLGVFGRRQIPEILGATVGSVKEALGRGGKPNA